MGWLKIHTKTWMSRERNKTFLWNKKKLTCASDGTFCEVKRFVAEVTFKTEVVRGVEVSNAKWVYPVVYAEPSLTFKMKRFAKMGNG